MSGERNWPSLADIPNPWTRISMKVGMLLLWFAAIEQRIDTNLWLSRAAGGRRGSHLSPSFKERLAEWSESFQPTDSSDQERMAALCDGLLWASNLRNDLAHNIRGVGAFRDAEPAWLNAVRQNSNYAKALSKWKSTPANERDGPEPEEFEPRQIPEDLLDRASVLLGHALADVVALADPRHKALHQQLFPELHPHKVE